MRIDTFTAVGVGIIVSICIVITTSNISDNTQDIEGIGSALEPLFGKVSTYFVGIGFISAGLTSAVTAPLAAAYVLNRLFNLNYKPEQIGFKRLSYLILFIGCIIAALDFNPVEVIKIAQVANAIILPTLVALLLWLAFQVKMIKLTKIYILLGFLVFVFSLSISISSIFKLFLK
jgi:Mn2+/Fe2+ NRAMP family transporter